MFWGHCYYLRLSCSHQPVLFGNKWPPASLPEASCSSCCASRCALGTSEVSWFIPELDHGWCCAGLCCRRLRELCAELSLSTFSLLHCLRGQCSLLWRPSQVHQTVVQLNSICLKLALSIKGAVMVQSAGYYCDTWRWVLKLQGLQRGLKCLFCSGGASGAAAAAKLKEVCILKPEQKTDCLCLFCLAKCRQCYLKSFCRRILYFK